MLAFANDTHCWFIELEVMLTLFVMSNDVVIGPIGPGDSGFLIWGHSFSTYAPKGVEGQAPCVCQCIVVIVTSQFVRTGGWGGV